MAFVTATVKSEAVGLLDPSWFWWQLVLTTITTMLIFLVNTEFSGKIKWDNAFSSSLVIIMFNIPTMEENPPTRLPRFTRHSFPAFSWDKESSVHSNDDSVKH